MNRTDTNSVIPTVTVTPAGSSNFELRYQATTPLAAQGLRNQNINRI
jgi:hypothetical protein